MPMRPVQIGRSRASTVHSRHASLFILVSATLVVVCWLGAGTVSASAEDIANGAIDRQTERTEDYPSQRVVFPALYMQHHQAAPPQHFYRRPIDDYMAEMGSRRVTGDEEDESMLGEPMAAMNEQSGDVVLLPSKSRPAAWDKRAQTFVRFGKRAQTFVRFGKRQSPLLASAGNEAGEAQKRAQTFVRFGKRAQTFVRFG